MSSFCIRVITLTFVADDTDDLYTTSPLRPPAASPAHKNREWRDRSFLRSLFRQSLNRTLPRRSPWNPWKILSRQAIRQGVRLLGLNPLNQQGLANLTFLRPVLVIATAATTTNMDWSLLIAIVTGVTANAVCWFFVQHVTPIIQTFVYRGIKVSGTWIVEQPQLASDGSTLTTNWETTVVLSQHAHQLKGTAGAQRKLENEEEEKEVVHYNVSGRIVDRFAYLEFQNSDCKRIAHSSFLLEVIGDGSLMAGYRSFYGLKAYKIRSIETRWKRGRS